MARWWPTAALLRAATVVGIGLVVALVGGSPVAAVLVAPFALLAAPALRTRPPTDPVLTSRVEHGSLREGQGTRSILDISPGDPAGGSPGALPLEHVTRVAVPTAYVATHPAGGRLGHLLAPVRARDGAPDRAPDGASVLELSPRRWGRRRLGHERIWVTSAWSGYRFGPVEVLGRELTVLPLGAAYSSRAEAPQPHGLVGAHRSARESAGTEFAGIRPFQPGDRLRRINWRVSSRTDKLHVTSSRAEDDTAVLLVVDALADLGRSGGLDGAASSLDIATRAAAALAEHYVLRGDRVGLRVVGLDGSTVPFHGGRRHLRRLLGTLATIRPGAPHDGVLDLLRLRAGPGTTVIVLSPMLSEPLASATATVCRRGLPTLVVDTLPPTVRGADVGTSAPDGTSRSSSGETVRGLPEDVVRRDAIRQAWRIRTLEREQVLASLAAVGCPVVAWRGPGTLDAVLHHLARRGSMARAR